MKTLVLLVLLGLFFVSSSNAQEVPKAPDGQTITLSPEQSFECQQGGGCLILPKMQLQMYIMQLKSMIEEEQKQKCLKGSV